jgi:hypothetical protein
MRDKAHPPRNIASAKDALLSALGEEGLAAPLPQVKDHDVRLDARQVDIDPIQLG